MPPRGTPPPPLKMAGNRILNARNNKAVAIRGINWCAAATGCGMRRPRTRQRRPDARSSSSGRCVRAPGRSPCARPTNPAALLTAALVPPCRRFGFNVGMGMVDGLWAGGSAAATDFGLIAYQLRLLGYNAGARACSAAAAGCRTPRCALQGGRQDARRRRSP